MQTVAIKLNLYKSVINAYRSDLVNLVNNRVNSINLPTYELLRLITAFALTLLSNV